MGYEIILWILALAGGGYVTQKTFKRVTIFEYECGLKYEKGTFKESLGPGSYWYNAYHTTIDKIDIRQKYQTIPSQEVLSKDGVAIKLSLVANIAVSQPVVAINSVNNYEEALYLVLQLALREVIGTTEIDRLLESRGSLGKEIFEKAKDEVEGFGVKLISVDIKDITLSGSLKQTFSQIVKARHEGLAALERARGEKAALRSLLNSAKIFEENPALLQLRTIQSFNESSGNTLVLNLSSEKVVPIEGTERKGAQEKG